MERQKAELKAKVEEAARLAKLKEEQEEERVTKRFKEEQELKKKRPNAPASNLLSGFKDSLKNKGDVGNGGQDTADAKKTNAENENEKTNREGVASRDGLGGFESSERIEEEILSDAIVSRTCEKFTSG